MSPSSRPLRRTILIIFLAITTLCLQACSSSGSRSSNTHYGAGLRNYHGDPWRAYHHADIIDTVDAIDTIDAIDSISPAPMPVMGIPDFGGGMDAGFDW